METGDGQAPAARRNAQIVAVFDQVAEVYDNVGVPWFKPIAEHLVRLIQPAAGERALDLGCGRGAALFLLAEAVGPMGRVTGIDLAPAMVAATAADTRSRGLSQVDVQVMDAVAPRLPAASYDLAVASFVLFFLPAPVAALRAWHELLAPGGRLGVSTFSDHQGGWMQELFQPYLPKPVFGPHSSPFDTDEGVEELLTTAGFTAVRTEAFDFAVTFRDTAQWYAWSWSHGQRAVWEQIAPADRPQVRADAEAYFSRFRAEDGTIRLTQRIRCTFGVRAG